LCGIVAVLFENVSPIFQVKLMESITDAGDMWSHKPVWCQPWTIVLTGVMMIAGSWIGFHRLWITIPGCGAIGLWWWYFLIVMPRLVREMAEQGQLE
jgi:hypothetical protein